jgi:hypothetical protein
MYAVVNQDPVSNEITWIGTNNDASSQADSTLNLTNPPIANIFGATAPTVNASLMVDNPATSMLKVSQNSATTAVPGHYVVHLWF